METIGGQAVVEGVMMLSDRKVAVAVRTKNGRITTKVERRRSFTKKYKNVPFVRGIFALVEMVFLGTKALMWSSQASGQEEEKISNAALAFTVVVSFLFGIGLFIAAPFYLATLLTEQHFLFNVIDGVLRVLLFLLYLVLISHIHDVRRLFQYHGAEHMAIHCHEHGKQLTISNVRKFSTLHPRCGTAFLFFVLVVSILLFSFIFSEQWFLKFSLRLLLIPVVAAISYELLKLSARYQRLRLFRLMILPGLWFQKITTQQPDQKQIEVAIASLKVVLR